MIHFDTTKAATAGHRSGLVRVGQRLLEELGTAATAVRWPFAAPVDPAGWYVTPELFSETECPGFTAWIESRACRSAAIYHDAIPLKHPHITWPQSVARHPAYMKLLARFDRVFAVSQASKTELEEYWRWLGLPRTPPVDVLPLGADFGGRARTTSRVPPKSDRPRLLMVGILEPRKNQAFLIDVCRRLWREGLSFELHLAGRANPHFGAQVRAAIKDAGREFAGAVTWHDSVDDATVADLYSSAKATAFPTIAEGCGLPLLESLWMGVPCVCSDLPVLRESADGGGCLPVRLNDTPAWCAALRRVLTDDAAADSLTREATTRKLPTWAETARALQRAL